MFCVITCSSINCLHSKTILSDIHVDKNEISVRQSIEHKNRHQVHIRFTQSYNIGTRSESGTRKGTRSSPNAGIKKKKEKKKMEYSASSPFLNSEFAVKTGTIHPRLNICFHTKNGRMGLGEGELKRRGNKHWKRDDACLSLFLVFL